MAIAHAGANPLHVVHVLYFAACRERTGIEQEAIALDGKTVADAVATLVARHPRLGDVAPLCRVAINARFAAADTVVPVGAELVLIPPVAGG